MYLWERSGIFSVEFSRQGSELLASVPLSTRAGLATIEVLSRLLVIIIMLSLTHSHSAIPDSACDLICDREDTRLSGRGGSVWEHLSMRFFYSPKTCGDRVII